MTYLIPDLEDTPPRTCLYAILTTHHIQTRTEGSICVRYRREEVLEHRLLFYVCPQNNPMRGAQTAFSSHPVPVLTASQGSSGHACPQGWYQAHVLISSSRERENHSDHLPGQVTSQGHCTAVQPVSHNQPPENQFNTYLCPPTRSSQTGRILRNSCIWGNSRQ